MPFDPPTEPQPERLTVPPGDILRQRLDRLPANHPSSLRYHPSDHEAGPRDDTRLAERTARGSRRELASPDDQSRGDLGARMLREVRLHPDERDRAVARDVIRNIDRAEMDPRKLSEYSMDSGHPQNNGKARAWAAVGYDVTSPERRREDAHELRELICRHLLPDGRVAATKETPDGADYRVVNGFIGPNGRHGTLVTCWRVALGEMAGPRLLTTWLAVHRDDGR